MSKLLKRHFKAQTCKTSLGMSVARIKVLKNKRENQVAIMRKNLAELLKTGQEQTAMIRVEHVIREQNTVAAYDMLESYCQQVVLRLAMIESQKVCPIDLQEAVSSIIFASPRCGDVTELNEVCDQFQKKYGKDFITAILELRPESRVNRIIIEKLTSKTPNGETKLKVLAAIAEEHHVEWDPSKLQKEVVPVGRPANEFIAGPSKFMSASDMPLQLPSVPSVSVQKPIAPPKVQETAPSQPTQFPASVASGNISKAEDAPSKHRGKGPQESKFSKESIKYNDEDNEMVYKTAADAANAAAKAAEMAKNAAFAAAILAMDGQLAESSSRPSSGSAAYQDSVAFEMTHVEENVSSKIDILSERLHEATENQNLPQATEKRQSIRESRKSVTDADSSSILDDDAPYPSRSEVKEHRRRTSGSNRHADRKSENYQDEESKSVVRESPRKKDDMPETKEHRRRTSGNDEIAGRKSQSYQSEEPTNVVRKSQKKNNDAEENSSFAYASIGGHPERESPKSGHDFSVLTSVVTEKRPEREASKPHKFSSSQYDDYASDDDVVDVLDPRSWEVEEPPHVDFPEFDPYAFEAEGSSNKPLRSSSQSSIHDSKSLIRKHSNERKDTKHQVTASAESSSMVDTYEETHQPPSAIISKRHSSEFDQSHGENEVEEDLKSGPTFDSDSEPDDLIDDDSDSDDLPDGRKHKAQKEIEENNNSRLSKNLPDQGSSVLSENFGESSVKEDHEPPEEEDSTSSHSGFNFERQPVGLKRYARPPYTKHPSHMFKNEEEDVPKQTVAEYNKEKNSLVKTSIVPEEPHSTQKKGKPRTVDYFSDDEVDESRNVDDEGYQRPVGRPKTTSVRTSNLTWKTKNESDVAESSEPVDQVSKGSYSSARSRRSQQVPVKQDEDEASDLPKPHIHESSRRNTETSYLGDPEEYQTASRKKGAINLSQERITRTSIPESSVKDNETSDSVFPEKYSVGSRKKESFDVGQEKVSRTSRTTNRYFDDVDTGNVYESESLRSSARVTSHTRKTTSKVDGDMETSNESRVKPSKTTESTVAAESSYRSPSYTSQTGLETSKLDVDRQVLDESRNRRSRVTESSLNAQTEDVEALSKPRHKKETYATMQEGEELSDNEEIKLPRPRKSRPISTEETARPVVRNDDSKEPRKPRHRTAASASSQESSKAEAKEIKPQHKTETSTSVQESAKLEVTTQNSQEAVKGSDSSRPSMSREDSLKRPAHVHEKLPDYDDFAAFFNKLKSNRPEQ